MSETESRFQIEVDEETTLRRNDTVAHAEYGPMHVDQISISAHGKRARLQAELREDRMSIELTEEEIQDGWGETLALDPFDLDDGKTRYKKEFASKDDEIEVTLKAAGPENDVQPVMAHLHDQTIRVLQAVENQQPPEECEGMYDIDWEAIFTEEDE
ncbi:MAG: hypothetical protein ACOCTH_01755 [Halodesulfurarchaeum sp.]